MLSPPLRTRSRRHGQPPALWFGAIKSGTRTRTPQDNELFSEKLTQLCQDRAAVLFPKIGGTAEVESLYLAGLLDHSQRSTAKPKSIVTQLMAHRKPLPTIKDAAMALKYAKRAYERPPCEHRVDCHTHEQWRIRRKGQQSYEMRSSDVDRYVEMTRREHQCAAVIQRFYRGRGKAREWMRDREQHWAAIKIQALVRGVITRRFIAVWVLKFERIVIQWQARVRGYLSNLDLRTRLTVESRAAAKIQSTVRMFLCRRRTAHRRKELAVVAIQRLWRGVVGRGIACRMYVDRATTVIQKRIRQKLARKRYVRWRSEAMEAAGKLQRAFRGFRSRQIRNRLLQERDWEHRRMHGYLLSAEEDYLQSKLTLAIKRLAQTKLRERCEESRAAYECGLKRVDELETEYLGFHRKKRMMSPRDLSAGWDKQYSDGIRGFRQRITQAKFDSVLDVALQSRRLEEELCSKSQSLSELQLKIASITRWRDEETTEDLLDQKRRRFREEALNRKKQTAEQRRRWKVRRLRLSGKIDRQSAAPLREVYSGGLAKLLCMSGPRTKTVGSESSLQHASDQLYLQIFHNEVAKGQEVLQPLMTAMRSGLPGVMAEPEKEPCREAAASVAAPLLLADPEQDTPIMLVCHESGVSSAAAEGGRDASPTAVVEGLDAASEPAAGAVAPSSPHSKPTFDIPGAAAARRLPNNYQAINRKRLQTDITLWPFDDAQSRIKPTIPQTILQSKLRAYGGKVSRRFRSPVTTVPWGLVDELEAERSRWAQEKAAFEGHILERMTGMEKSSTPFSVKDLPERSQLFATES